MIVHDECKILGFLILLLWTIFMAIHIKYVKAALTKGSRLMTVEAFGRVPTLPSPKSGPA